MSSLENQFRSSQQPETKEEETPVADVQPSSAPIDVDEEADLEKLDSFSTNLLFREKPPRLMEAKDDQLFNKELTGRYLSQGDEKKTNVKNKEKDRIKDKSLKSPLTKRRRDEEDGKDSFLTPAKKQRTNGSDREGGRQGKTPKRESNRRSLSSSSSSSSLSSSSTPSLDPQPTLTFEDIGGIEDRIQDGSSLSFSLLLNRDL